MDADLRPEPRPHGVPTKVFEPSLFVWATVMSRRAEDGAIVDAGLKALSLRLRPAHRLRRSHLRSRLRRVRPARGLGRHQPPRARRQDRHDPRPLRPDRQPLRLVASATAASSSSHRSTPAARFTDARHLGPRLIRYRLFRSPQYRSRSCACRACPSEAAAMLPRSRSSAGI